jgi:hypothetical protein
VLRAISGRRAVGITPARAAAGPAPALVFRKAGVVDRSGAAKMLLRRPSGLFPFRSETKRVSFDFIF